MKESFHRPDRPVDALEGPQMIEIPYQYSFGSPMPPEADAEVLGLLAELRGESAVRELDQAAQILADVVAAQTVAVGSGDDRARRLATAMNAAARRRVYAARAVALRRLLKMKPAATAALEVPDVARILGSWGDHQYEISRTVEKLKTERDAAAKQLAALKAEAADESYEALGKRPPLWVGARRDVETIKRIAADALAKFRGQQPAIEDRILTLAVGDLLSVAKPTDLPSSRHWPQDGLIEKLAEVLARRRDAEGRLAALEGDRDASASTVSRIVGQAVADAGGRDEVVSRVVFAQHLAGKFPDELAQHVARVRALETDLADRESSWSRLALAIGDHLNGPAAVDLRTKRDAAAAAVKSARDELVRRQTDLADDLVDRAMIGDESARRRLEELSGLAAEAFPAGFGPAIAGARFDLAAAAELVATLKSAA